MKICIDAGHGINTPGKRTPRFEDGTFMKEFEFNSKVAEYLKEELINYRDVEVVFTHDHPSGITDVPLRDRTNMANRIKADLFISIHADAFGDGQDFNSAHGLTTFIYNKVPRETLEIAEAIHQELIRDTGRRDRGVKRENFHVLRETTMPAVLIEHGFMTNLGDATLLRNDSFRRRCGLSIANAVAGYYKLVKKEEDYLYKVQVGAFSKKSNADRLAKELKEKGYSVYIIKEKIGAN